MKKSLYRLPGVYRIVNVATGRVYVGGTVNLGRRLSVHKSTLRNGGNKNRELQADFAKFGEGAFEFIHFPCDRSQVCALEQSLLDESFASGVPYNIQPKVGTSCGEKLRHTRKGSETHRELARQLGRAPKSAEHRRRISEAKKGLPATAAARASLKAAWVKRKQRMANVDNAGR